MKKLLVFLSIVLVLQITLIAPLQAYNYSYYEEPIHSAPAKIIKDVITSDEMRLEYDGDVHDIRMTNPVDVFVHNDIIYIVDNEQDKLIMLDSDYNVIREYPSSIPTHPEHPSNLTPDLLLNGPRGIHVNDDSIAIADTDNGRIVIFDHNFNKIDEFGRPDDVSFEQTEMEYRPRKLTRDSTGRLYVVAQGVYEGIIELNPDGTFTRYTGVTRVAISPLEIFWMNFMTEQQRAQMMLRLPPTFINVHMDSRNFLYAVSNPADDTVGDEMIKRINPRGLDVLKTQGFFPPKGDVDFVLDSEVVENGPSSFSDITVNDYGMYNVLDNKRGRIFTYDQEGNLLYITGQMGSQRGDFSNPRAIDYHGEDLLVVDSGNRSLIIYENTEFGSLVNLATKQYFNSEYAAAAETWREVLRLNANYYLAYRGIGRAALRNGEFEKALGYFELSNDHHNYSLAYAEYRNMRLETYFPFIMGGISLLIIYLFYSSIKNSLKANQDTGRED